MKTCKMCKYCIVRQIPWDVPWYGGTIFYECEIKNKSLHHLTLASIFCRWFSYNERCREALKERNEI